jgi:deoxyhypusine synthase
MGINDEPAVAKRRRELAERRGEPIDSVERSVIEIDGALYVNVPDFSTTLLDISTGDTVIVHEYDDRIVTKPRCEEATE